MSEDTKVGRTRLSAAEFVTALGRSEILPEGQWREIRDRFGRTKERVDSLVLAHQLIEENYLTRFQARRLLKGKKSLTLGRYALIDHIGQGARGRVFKARHRLMDRVVALKVLSPIGTLSKTSVARFFREMKIVGLLDHPHVVRAIDADVHDGCPYIVMEYLEGEDLEKVFVRRGPLPSDEVITLMAQAARGLSHAHEMGVIHRDVKPTNLFQLKSGLVKVLDLGFGELVGMQGQAGNVFDTDEGIVVGTTDFMSPEQVKDKAIDARTDLFSLGCSMYRLLAGTYAFTGATREDRLVKRIREGHTPIADVRPDVPDRLATIIDRLLAVRPSDRFGSAAEVADLLEAIAPSKRRSEDLTGTKRGARTLDLAPPSTPAEPEAPLDWSMIESALRPPRQTTREPQRLAGRNEPKTPAARGISSHRKIIEAEGDESGREVHEKYRSELIQMKKVMAELRTTEPAEKAADAGNTWLERGGEWLGDLLADPSAFQIIVAVLAVLILLVIGFSIALG